MRLGFASLQAVYLDHAVLATALGAQSGSRLEGTRTRYGDDVSWRYLLPLRSPIPICLATCWHTISLVSKTFSSSRLLLGNEKEKAPQLAPLQDPQQTLALTKYRTLPPSYKHVPYHHNHYDCVLDQHTLELRKDYRVHMDARTSQ